MCGGVEVNERYTQSGKPVKVYFPNPYAQLPLLLEGGQVEWVPWGRRGDKQPGKLPATGWARTESITAGKWARYHPREVRILADRFMEKDEAKVSHWFDLEPDQCIQGLLLEDGEERRVYVVTGQPPDGFEMYHNRWPLLSS